MSTFNAAAFAGGSFEGEGDTRRFKLEPGEYNAMIQGPFNDPKATRILPPKTEGNSPMLMIVWQPDSPELQAKYQLQRLPSVRQTIFLDVTEGGGLDMGPFKNSDLNVLRGVFNMNKKGVKWAFADFIGKTARITVEHRPNPEKPEDPFVNVSAVTPL